MAVEAELAQARDIHRQGKISEAVPVYERILQEQPEHPEALHLLGVAKLQTGEPKAALQLLERAVAFAPENAKIQNNLGTVLLALGRPAEAADRFRAAAKCNSEFADAQFNLGNALGSMGTTEEASAAYREALRIDPGHGAASNNLGAIHQGRGEPQAAAELYRNALDSAPQSVEFRSNLVAALEMLNRLEEAEQEAQELLRAAPEFPIARLMRARLDRRAKRPEAARDGLQAAIDSAPPHSVMVPLYFEMARVLDELGDYGGAFEACGRAKEARGKLPDAARWNLDSYPEKVARQSAWFTAGRMASIPAVPGPQGAAPVFFVGFPRSGTTLMENVLGAHPGFATTGERSPLDRVFNESEDRIGRAIALPDDLATLTPDEIEVLQQKFFEIGEEVVGGRLESRILLDKMPLNITELGVANWLFPHSRAIVALRDPRDVVLSCYMQNFSLNRAMQQFLTLEGAARFYAQVMALWLQLRELLTMPWHEYRYEDLVADFDGTVAGVLDFLGVPWDESVQQFADHAKTTQISTPSYEAVAQPIHSRAAGRWRNYERELAPILPILEPFVKEFGYEPS